MPYRGDPYRELGLPYDASDASIKRRWRELAREHHPDRAGVPPGDALRQTRRMARINAAYEVLSEPARRAEYDAGSGRAATRRTSNGSRPRPFEGGGEQPRRTGPPPPPPTRPVTARFDTSELYHPRNTTTSNGTAAFRPVQPFSAREREAGREPLRASTPTGPVERRESRVRHELPSAAEARASTLEFGKFRGLTLGQVELIEPSYIDWIARTITRDRQLVLCARAIRGCLEEGRGGDATEPRDGRFRGRDENEVPADAGTSFQ